MTIDEFEDLLRTYGFSNQSDGSVFPIDEHWWHYAGFPCSNNTFFTGYTAHSVFICSNFSIKSGLLSSGNRQMLTDFSTAASMLPAIVNDLKNKIKEYRLNKIEEL